MDLPKELRFLIVEESAWWYNPYLKWRFIEGEFWKNAEILGLSSDWLNGMEP